MFNASSNFLTGRSQAVLLLWILFVSLSLSYCPVLSWQPCGHLQGKDWPLGSLCAVMFYSVFISFLYGVLGQVWYLIESIPYLCLLHFILGYVLFTDCPL